MSSAKVIFNKIIEYWAWDRSVVRQTRSSLDAIFGALADPTRRAILAQLSLGDAYVSDLAQPHAMSLAAVSRHVHVLSKAGLAHLTREGRSVRCTLNPARLRDVSDWLTDYRRFWEEKLDALGDILERDDVPG